MTDLPAPATPDSQDPQMKGEPGEVRFTVSITRASTGLTDHFDVIGTLLPCEDSDDGCDPHDRGA